MTNNTGLPANTPATSPITSGAPAATPPPRIRLRTRPSVGSPVETLPGRGSLAEDQPAYAIGYGRPPQATKFRPGQSGNPRGRPRAAKGLKTIVRETLTAKVPVRTAAGEKKMSRMEAVLHKTVELGMKGNGSALAQLIALYRASVPDPVVGANAAPSAEELTATDIAMLEELKASWASNGGGGQ
jgi:hypothetical protein